MKTGAAVIELIKKYDFRREVPPEVRRRMLGSRKRILVKILHDRKGAGRALSWFYLDALMMNRRAVLAAAMITVVVAAGLLVVATVPGLRLPLARGVDPTVARAVFVEGDVRFVRGETTGPLAPGEDIGAGVSIRTGSGGFVLLQVDDLGTVTVHENTSFTLGAVAGRGDTEMALDRGSVYSKLLKRGPGESYRVKTLNYTAAVRGTEFLASAVNGRQGVMVYEGVVAMASPTATVEVTRGKGATVGAAGVVKEYALTEREMLMLRKESLQPYNKDLRGMSTGALKEQRETIRKQEAEMSRLIVAMGGETALGPLDSLRKKNMPLTMLYLSDGSQIAGSVLGQENGKLRLDTGDGIVEIPVADIIRRMPMN